MGVSLYVGLFFLSFMASLLVNKFMLFVWYGIMIR